MEKSPFNSLTTMIGRKLRLIMLFFALLFSLSAAAQYLFIKYQLDKARTSQAETWAAEIVTELAYTTRWELKEFRQADWEAPNSFVFATNGVLVDVEGFAPGLIPQVTLPDGLSYERPQTNVSEIGEPWRLFAKRVHGGTVVLGISYPDNPSVEDETLVADAGKFGSSVESALNVRPRSIAREIDYCIVDDAGDLKFAIGGIPLRTKTPLPTILSRTLWQVATNGHSYSVFTTPVIDKSNAVVGMVTIPMDSTLEHKTLGNAVKFNIMLALTSWVVVGILTAKYFINYEVRRRAIDISVEEALKLPESDTLEFKSSVRWDYNRRQANRALEDVIVKTVVAFLNSSGGILIIGVDDDRTIKGLQPDYDSLKKNNRDGLELHLQQMISERIGIDRYQIHVSLQFHGIDGKDVCMMRITPAPKPVVMKEQNQPSLYVRAGNATRALNVEEAIRYVQEHWSKFL